MDSIGSFVLNTLLPRLPILAVALVGMVFAMTRWGRHPRAALLAFFGCGLQFLVTVVGMLWYTYLRELVDPSSETIQSFYTLSGVCFGLIDAAGLGLLVWAVFIERSGAPPRPWPRPELGPAPAPRPERPYPGPSAGPDRPDAFRQ